MFYRLGWAAIIHETDGLFFHNFLIVSSHGWQRTFSEALSGPFL